MKTMLKRSIGITLTAASILASASALADANQCKMHNATYYERTLRGDWLLDDTIPLDDKTYEVRVHMGDHMFHAYVDEINHANNQMATIDGTWHVNGQNIDLTVTDSNMPKIEGKTTSIPIVCMGRKIITLQGDKDSVTFHKQ